LVSAADESIGWSVRVARQRLHAHWPRHIVRKRGPPPRGRLQWRASRTLLDMDRMALPQQQIIIMDRQLPVQ
jgi:hypothetical protein